MRNIPKNGKNTGKIEIIITSLLAFVIFAPVTSLYIYSHFVRITLKVRAEHVPCHLIFYMSFVINLMIFLLLEHFQYLIISRLPLELML